MKPDRFTFYTKNENLIVYLRSKVNYSKYIELLLLDIMAGKYIPKTDQDLELKKQTAQVKKIELQCQKLELEIKYFNFTGKVPSKVFVKKVIAGREFNTTEEINILEFFDVTRIDSYSNVWKIQCKNCFYNCRVSEDEKTKNAYDHIQNDHSDLIK